MFFDELGGKNDHVLLMLHGMNNVYTFRKNYILARKFHIIVPHLMGFGERTDMVFNLGFQVEELSKFIMSLNKKVSLVGFSLGAVVGTWLICKYKDLFNNAVLVSPTFFEDKSLQHELVKGTMKGLKVMRNHFLCNLLAIFSGMKKPFRKKFVEQSGRVSDETAINAVKACFGDVPCEICGVDFPVSVLYGEREPDITKNTVNKMCNMNKEFRSVEFKSAVHNIPTKFSSDFNKMVYDVCG